MAALPEELELELEALRATYDRVEVILGDGEQVAASGATTAAVVAVPVAPRTADGGDAQQYVVGQLVVSVGPSYPELVPSVHLEDVKGLGDVRLAEVQAALATEAASLAGELQLGHLCETAIDLLTAANWPEGTCAFCLEPLLPLPGQRPPGGPAAAGGNAGGVPAAGAVLRLPCYHCYHMACFAPWWQWQQARLAGREQQLREEYKSMAPLKMEEEGIRWELCAEGPSSSGCGSGSGGGGGAYVLSCPACRTDIPPSSLAHVGEQLQAASADSWSGGGGGSAVAHGTRGSRGGGGGGGSSGRAALAELSPQQRQHLAALQRRHAAVMRRQQECGGLVDATHSVSLSDLRQAAAAAAATAAAAAPAAAAQEQQQAAAEAVAVAAVSAAAELPAHCASSSGGGGRGRGQPARGGRGGAGRTPHQQQHARGREQTHLQHQAEQQQQQRQQQYRLQHQAPQQHQQQGSGSGGRHGGPGGRGRGRRAGHAAPVPPAMTGGHGSATVVPAMAAMRLADAAGTRQGLAVQQQQGQQQPLPTGQQQRRPGSGRGRGRSGRAATAAVPTPAAAASPVAG